VITAIALDQRLLLTFSSSRESGIEGRRNIRIKPVDHFERVGKRPLKQPARDTV